MSIFQTVGKQKGERAGQKGTYPLLEMPNISLSEVLPTLITLSSKGTVVWFCCFKQDTLPGKHGF